MDKVEEIFNSYEKRNNIYYDLESAEYQFSQLIFNLKFTQTSKQSLIIEKLEKAHEEYKNILKRDVIRFILENIDITEISRKK